MRFNIFNHIEDNITCFECLCSYFLLNKIVFIFKLLQINSRIIGKNNKINLRFKNSFEYIHNSINHNINLMIFFNDFNNKTKNRMFDNDILNYLIFLSIQDHYVKYFDKIEMLYAYFIYFI